MATSRRAGRRATTRRRRRREASRGYRRRRTRRGAREAHRAGAVIHAAMCGCPTRAIARRSTTRPRERYGRPQFTDQRPRTLPGTRGRCLSKGTVRPRSEGDQRQPVAERLGHVEARELRGTQLRATSRRQPTEVCAHEAVIRSYLPLRKP